MTYEITVDHCIEIYQRYVGAGQLTRLDVLASAVAAPFSGFDGAETFPTLIEKAARLLYGIAQAQAFEDGNKRLAWLCTVRFLELNGITIDMVDPNEINVVIRALGERELDGSPRLTYEGLVNWFNECLTYRSAKPQNTNSV